MKEYTFYDTSLSDCIENAFQALALDEQRAPFQPAIWEKKSRNRTVSCLGQNSMYMLTGFKESQTSMVPRRSF